ncbi:MAG TPA: aminotransferase class IV [Rubrobacteraceae bacterium]|nr:aminotransferase class IV [Rubrobacteraceae bacterium]
MSETRLVWVNGKLLPLGEAALDPRDRGFTLGDGLFETMRVRKGTVLQLERHLSRLQAGAAVLGLSPLLENEDLTDAITRTLTANRLAEAAVRLTVSRGVTKRRGLLPEPDQNPSLVIHAEPFVGYPAELYDRGVRAVVSSTRRNERSPLARVKSLNYLDNVLARRAAEASGAGDALLLNTAGDLTCASAANLFLLLDGALVTPSVASGALPGTLRGLVVAELALRTGLEVVERAVRPEELAAADEAFLTNALLGVAPLTEVDALPVGRGVPGPVSVRLCAELRDE